MSQEKDSEMRGRGKMEHCRRKDHRGGDGTGKIPHKVGDGDSPH